MSFTLKGSRSPDAGASNRNPGIEQLLHKPARWHTLARAVKQASKIPQRACENDSVAPEVR